jgi:sugar diacid utilization regulator
MKLHGNARLSPKGRLLLCQRVLEPLGTKHRRSRGDLRRTVATYVALRRDRRRTAKRLHIHPNTLDHRLHHARELTGLDLDDPEDLAKMVLALREDRRPSRLGERDLLSEASRD